MTITLSRVVALTGAGLLLVSGAWSTAAGARTGGRRGEGLARHRLTATLQEVDIVTERVPLAGGTATAAATVKSNPGGSGAQVTQITFTGPTRAPATFAFNARATAFFAHGSLNFALTGTLAVQSGGSLRFVGRGTITGGTERYARARGAVNFVGTAPSAGPGHVDTFHYVGTVSY